MPVKTPVAAGDSRHHSGSKDSKVITGLLHVFLELCTGLEILTRLEKFVCSLDGSTCVQRGMECDIYTRPFNSMLIIRRKPLVHWPAAYHETQRVLGIKKQGAFWRRKSCF